MIRLIIAIALLLSRCAYAQVDIADLSNQSIAILNDEQRKTRDELRSVKSGLLVVNAITLNGYNTSTSLGDSKIYVSDGSNYLPLGAMIWLPNNVTAFTENGTWVRPANVTRVYVKIWGAGGRPNQNAGGGGGGGGGYTEDIKNVSGNIAVIIAGGSHTTYRTSFNDTLNATTGTDGSGTGGGAGGQGYGGRINLLGGQGSGGSSDTGYHGGSGGGSPFGGAGGGGGSNTTPGANGCIPGGGAGGGTSSGYGANGTVIVYY
jgi:hypothetical protein